MLKGSLLLFSGEITEDGDTKLTPLEVGHRKDGAVFIKVSAPSGTDPTLNVDVISKDEKTDEWYVIGSFKEFTAAGKQRMYIPATDEQMAIQYVITGTNTPKFPVVIVSTILN